MNLVLVIAIIILLYLVVFSTWKISSIFYYLFLIIWSYLLYQTFNLIKEDELLTKEDADLLILGIVTFYSNVIMFITSHFVLGTKINETGLIRKISNFYKEKKSPKAYKYLHFSTVILFTGSLIIFLIKVLFYSGGN